MPPRIEVDTPVRSFEAVEESKRHPRSGEHSIERELGNTMRMNRLLATAVAGVLPALRLSVGAAF